jgi:hypothetical protein
VIEDSSDIFHIGQSVTELCPGNFKKSTKILLFGHFWT